MLCCLLLLKFCEMDNMKILLFCHNRVVYGLVNFQRRVHDISNYCCIVLYSWASAGIFVGGIIFIRGGTK